MPWFLRIPERARFLASAQAGCLARPEDGAALPGVLNACTMDAMHLNELGVIRIIIQLVEDAILDAFRAKPKGGAAGGAAAARGAGGGAADGGDGTPADGKAKKKEKKGKLSKEGRAVWAAFEKRLAGVKAFRDGVRTRRAFGEGISGRQHLTASDYADLLPAYIAGECLVKPR